MALSIAPSGGWAGNDGSWSTFNVHIGLGTKAQLMEVLPATSQSEIWVNSPLGCPSGFPTDCLTSRGGVFNTTTDGTWATQSTNGGTTTFQLPFESELSLNYSATGMVGLDDAALDWSGTGRSIPDGPIQNEVIAAYTAYAPWLGYLGLSGYDVHLFNASTNQSSLLYSLSENKNKYAHYWAYTAGAPYATPPTLGSLTVGGYDAFRLTDMTTALTVPFSEPSTQDLQVVIDQISISGTTISTWTKSNMDQYAMIDSTVPQIVLPQAICAGFESVLGISWDANQSMYLISDTQHANLVTQNPLISFTLAKPAGPGTVNIQLPYAAFDLTVGFPLAGINDGSTRLKYFPLKRAVSDNQAFLGRTFLQHAYVTADYDRHLFTVSPALFPAQAGATNIKVVHPPGYNPGLSAGAIAGVVIGVLAAVALIAGLVYWFWWRPRASRKKSIARSLRTASIGNTTVVGDTEMSDWDRTEYYKPPPPGGETPNGMPTADEYFKPELDATATALGPVGQQTERHELDAGSVRPMHRHGMSWGSAESGVSSMSDERMRGIAGEPSPPIGSGSPSPPLSGGGRHSRSHSAGNPWSPWGPPHEMP